MLYVPMDHYWLVGTDEELVWSSKESRFVPVDDEKYLAWLVTKDAIPSRVRSMGELVETLRSANVPPYHMVSTYCIVRRIEAAGKAEAAMALLDKNPVLKMRFLALQSIFADDAGAAALLTALGLTTSEILAPEQKP